MLKILKQFAN